jgi:hypothetical protein
MAYGRKEGIIFLLIFGMAESHALTPTSRTTESLPAIFPPSRLTGMVWFCDNDWQRRKNSAAESGNTNAESR